MPYFLSPIINESLEPMWFEGSPYSKKNLYSIKKGQPPVNYDEHTLRPHSITHVEFPRHTQENGKTSSEFFRDGFEHFWGKAIVIKLKGNNFKLIDSKNDIFQWVISKAELEPYFLKKTYSFIFITCESAPYLENGFHDPKFVLTLSRDAAKFITSRDKFRAYGTSWKSSDYSNGNKERPIHNIIFEKGIIFENLCLKKVPEGEYFFCGIPTPIHNASEIALCPVLFTRDELFTSF